MSLRPFTESIKSRIRSVLQSRKTWWTAASPFGRWIPALLLLLYLAFHGLLGGLRGDHLIYAGFIGVLYYTGPKGHHVLHFLLPLLLVAMIYDAQQYYAPILRSTVRIQEPFQLELALFGIGDLTPSQWFQSNTHPLLDVVTGFAYFSFVHAYVLMAAYLYFYLPYRSSESAEKTSYRRLGQSMMLGFLVVALLGYVTYLLYPAAPPWYVDRYGFNLIADAPPEAAGAARFDRLVGFPVFEAFYAKNTNIFGAIPSLHCGQMFLALYFSFLAGKLRMLSSVFFVAVLFGSVYLNHHYIIDALLGILFAIFVGWVISRIMNLKKTAI